MGEICILLQRCIDSTLSQAHVCEYVISLFSKINILVLTLVAPRLPERPPGQLKIPVVSLHCVVKAASNHFHTAGTKPKLLLLPAAAAMAAHWEVHVTGGALLEEHLRPLARHLPPCGSPVGVHVTAPAIATSVHRPLAEHADVATHVAWVVETMKRTRNSRKLHISLHDPQKLNVVVKSTAARLSEPTESRF